MREVYQILAVPLSDSLVGQWQETHLRKSPRRDLGSHLPTFLPEHEEIEHRDTVPLGWKGGHRRPHAKRRQAIRPGVRQPYQIHQDSHRSRSLRDYSRIRSGIPQAIILKMGECQSGKHLGTSLLEDRQIVRVVDQLLESVCAGVGPSGNYGIVHQC